MHKDKLLVAGTAPVVVVEEAGDEVFRSYGTFYDYLCVFIRLNLI